MKLKNVKSMGMYMTDIVLTITLTQSGIQVGGPLHDKILCMGLLELAKQSVINYDPSKIIVTQTSP